MLWLALVAVTSLWGAWLNVTGHDLHLSAAPLAGWIDVRFGWPLIPPVALAALAVLFGQGAAARLPWGSLCWLTSSVAAIWAVSLSATRGLLALTAPLLSPYDYLASVPSVDTPAAFLRTFASHLGSYAIHVQGHPPGMVLLLWAMDRIGFGGASWVAALVIAVGASAGAAALVATRAIAGEQAARTAAPFLAISPAALWIATSADALYMGVAAWGVAIFVLATRGRDMHADLLAASAGLLLGASLFLSYGLGLVAPLVLGSALRARRVRPLMIAAIVVAGVVAAFAAAGFWWLDGLQATTMRYYAIGTGDSRPYLYFLFADVGAFALATGPAAAAALASARRTAALLLPACGLLAVGLADLSGLSKGEVERIWLPFAVWVLAATAFLPRASARRWLAAQAVVALLIQILVRTPW